MITNKKFRDLIVGDEFDFTATKYQSFFDRCVKTGKRTYQSLSTLQEYRVGSINVLVKYLGHDSSADFA